MSVTPNRGSAEQKNSGCQADAKLEGS